MFLLTLLKFRKKRRWFTEHFSNAALFCLLAAVISHEPDWLNVLDLDRTSRPVGIYVQNTDIPWHAYPVMIFTVISMVLVFFLNRIKGHA